MFCYKCGNQVADDAQFCAKCGTRLTGNDVRKSNGSRKINPNVAALLALFLGAFGVHDFYCKNTKHGLIKLILGVTGIVSIVSAVWGLIDLYHIGRGEYFDGEGEKVGPVSWVKWILVVIAVASALYVVIIVLLVSIIISMFNSAKSQELSFVASELKNREITYFQAKKTMGDLADIGFLVPQSKNFEYRVKNNEFVAILQDNIGDCPKDALLGWQVGKKDGDIFFRCVIYPDTTGALDFFGREIEKKYVACKNMAKDFVALCDSLTSVDEMRELIVKNVRFTLGAFFTTQKIFMRMDGSYKFDSTAHYGDNTYFDMAQFSVEDSVGFTITSKREMLGCPKNVTWSWKNRKTSKRPWVMTVSENGSNLDSCRITGMFFDAAYKASEKKVLMEADVEKKTSEWNMKE